LELRGQRPLRRLFRLALKDPNHRVAGNALVGLHRLGEDLDVIRHLGKMARRPEPLFRASAAWVMGQTGEERYIGVLRQMVRDPDSLVRLNALRSLRRINLASAAKAARPASTAARRRVSKNNYHLTHRSVWVRLVV
jgi:HEAT repeat protein